MGIKTCENHICLIFIRDLTCRAFQVWGQPWLRRSLVCQRVANSKVPPPARTRPSFQICPKPFQISRTPSFFLFPGSRNTEPVCKEHRSWGNLDSPICLGCGSGGSCCGGCSCCGVCYCGCCCGGFGCDFGFDCDRVMSTKSSRNRWVWCWQTHPDPNYYLCFWETRCYVHRCFGFQQTRCCPNYFLRNLFAFQLRSLHCLLVQIDL